MKFRPQTDLNGKLRFDLVEQGNPAHAAKLRFYFTPKGGKRTVVKRPWDANLDANSLHPDPQPLEFTISATKDHGISLSQGSRFFYESVILGAKFGNTTADFQFLISSDAMISASIRFQGGLWRSVGQDSPGSGLFYIVQAADGLGFVRHNNQPEYWPPTDSLEWDLRVLDFPRRRSCQIDPRPVYHQLQTPMSHFHKQPLPKEKP